MSWTASPPIVSAASNICAWTLQARSQVGWRLMVASSAKTRRPRASAVALGPIFLAEETKASIAAAGDDATGAAGLSVLERSFFSVMRDHGLAQDVVLSVAACNVPADAAPVALSAASGGARCDARCPRR